jgi:NTE family protein
VSPEKRRVAIACQGGGSHTAFTAGALTRFLQPDVLDDHEFVALSGTSGGAICAAIAWSALLRERPEEAEGLLKGFWAANSATSLQEQVLNHMTLWGTRFAETVVLPAVSPYLTPASTWTSNQLRRLIDDTVDLDAAQALAHHAEDPPRLLLGAVDVLKGRFRTFDSGDDEISTDAVLASAAIPNIFRAVHLDGGTYWDGLFSQNPPVHPLLDFLPDELWVIQISPSHIDTEPTQLGEISTRRNELSGNLSLYQELGFIERVDGWLAAGAIQSEKVKHITVRILEMQRTPSTRAWGSASMLNREASFIAELVELGETQAQEHLDALRFEQAWDDPDLVPLMEHFAPGAVVSSTHPLALLETTADRERIRRFLEEFGWRVVASRARLCAHGATWTVQATEDRRIQAKVRAHFEDGLVTRFTVDED